MGRCMELLIYNREKQRREWRCNREWWVEPSGSLLGAVFSKPLLSHSVDLLGRVCWCRSHSALSGCEHGQGHGHTLLLSISSYLTLGFMTWQSRPRQAHQSYDCNEFARRKSHFQSLLSLINHVVGVFFNLTLKGSEQCTGSHLSIKEAAQSMMVYFSALGS